MEATDKNSMKIKPPVYILLPICVETKTDVFYNILKKTLARKKLKDHYLDTAFKMGLMGDKVYIEMDDINRNWRELESKDQQIRQSKLIGYWAIDNFPSLGKKLCGKSWSPSKESRVQVIEHSKEISSQENDATVFQKLKIRVMQLNVSENTFCKLKHFVNVPAYIGKSSGSQITPKIKSFDVDCEWVEQCWKALKMGHFPLDVNVHVCILLFINRLR